MDDRKKSLTEWFYGLQERICTVLEGLEAEFNEPGQKNRLSFTKTPWDYEQKGGGIMALIRNGKVFAKAGVNVSCVSGEFSSEFRSQIPGTEKDPRFWAAGISLVVHPVNPYVPIIHMNTRHIVTTKAWFGGGMDLTPVINNPHDTKFFHNKLKSYCDQHNPQYYEKFKKWCDEYFYLPHRKEPRGVGGIFYDYLDSNNFNADFAFNRDVGEAFLNIYPQIVRFNMHKIWGGTEYKEQLIKRGRYVEFNLLWDRGTQFGLKTGGNTEAILMSLPPLASWA